MIHNHLCLSDGPAVLSDSKWEGQAQICLALWMIFENVDLGSAALDAEFPYWKKPEVISRVEDTGRNTNVVLSGVTEGVKGA